MYCSFPSDFAVGSSRKPVVTPFVRALSVLAAFTPNDKWLCNSDLAKRTGLAASTVTRMTRTLVALGYLRCTAGRFYLAPSTLALGYCAAVDTEVHQAANQHMRQFADHHHMQVTMCARDRLDLVVIDSCSTNAFPVALQPGVGTRLRLTASAAGWALLAVLPEDERDYLLRSTEHLPQSHRRWMRRRSTEAMVQVRAGGFCVAPGESGQPMTVVAAPIHLPGKPPLSISCTGPALRVDRTRVIRELGPALVRMVREIQQAQA